MTDDLWQLEDVRLGLPTQFRLQAEFVSIPKGVTAVLGESGAGKTSLLNLLVGFETPASGVVRQSTQQMIAWVPADFGLWSPLTVEQHLASVIPSNALTSSLNARPGSLISDSKRASEPLQEWLELFDLHTLAHQRPGTLSMGERSRLSVARALASGASVMVMDEPLVHVDRQRLPNYWRVIRDVLQQRNGSLIFSTHSPERVLKEAEHVICLEGGYVVWQGAVDALYQNPPNKKLAQTLGQTNWLDASEVAVWLHQSGETPLSLRPEQLTLLPKETGPFRVEQSHATGTLAETALVDEANQQRRTFLHQTTHPPLQPGSRVAIKTFLTSLLFLIAVICHGCQRSHGDELELTITDVSHHSLPVEGAMLPAPRGMTYSPAGELFVLDNAGRVIVYDANGTFSRKWWMPEYAVGKPEGIWVLLDGRVAVADTHYHQVVFFDQQGTLLGTLGENGHGPSQFVYVIAVTQDPNGFLYVAENGGNDRVQKFTADGEYVTSIGACGVEPGEFQRPSGVVWSNGELYIADAINNRIQVFKDDGTFVKVIAEDAGLYYPYDLAQAPDGSLFVPEYGAGRISQISKEGKLLGRHGREGRGLGEFWTPWGIAVSQTGAVAIADTGNRRIVEMQLAQFKHLKPKMIKTKSAQNTNSKEVAK